MPAETAGHGTGDVMEILKVVLTYVLTLYLVVLIGCMILSWIQVFARSWYPTASSWCWLRGFSQRPIHH